MVDAPVMDTADEEIAELTSLVERLLRERRAGPDRCCHTGCLHCPEGRRMAWHRHPPT
jgi:hypothetical protein